MGVTAANVAKAARVEKVEVSEADLVSVNVSVLCGACSGPPEIRVLESGSRLATLALRCPSGDDRATSVPVTVWDPPAWLETVAAGDRLVVVGRLRRRFFQRPGGVGSRVDVEAELVGAPTTAAGSTRRSVVRSGRSRRSTTGRGDTGAGVRM